jgi:hypothetical protein
MVLAVSASAAEGIQSAILQHQGVILCLCWNHWRIICSRVLKNSIFLNFFEQMTVKVNIIVEIKNTLHIFEMIIENRE